MQSWITILASVCINDCHERVTRDPAGDRHAGKYRTAWGNFFNKMLFFQENFICSSLTVNGMADASLPFIAFSVLILGIIGILFLIAREKGTE